MFNSEVFQEWCGDFVKRVKERHGELPVVLLLDAASQHRQFPATANIKVIQLPPKLTHYFQPADQFIIANTRKFMRLAGYEHEQRVMAKVGLKYSIRTITAA